MYFHQIGEIWNLDYILIPYHIYCDKFIQELSTELNKVAVVPRYELNMYFAKFRNIWKSTQYLAGLKISF